MKYNIKKMNSNKDLVSYEIDSPIIKTNISQGVANLYVQILKLG